MIRTLFVTLIILIIYAGSSLAIDVPPPPIDIDISNSSFEKIDSTSFRIRQLIAPDYPDSYWVDFLWKPDLLHFEPSIVEKETTSYRKHRVAIVDKSGKYYSDPVTAMNDIASWCGTPSETNPCLVKILPGVYDIGSNILWVNSHVDIEGSGENVTIIRGGSDNNNEILVGMSNHTEIRFLTVENIGGGLNSTAIFSPPALEVKIANVTMIASGGIEGNYGFSTFTVFIPLPSSIKLLNATIKVSGDSINYGVANYSSILSMKNVAITVTGGSMNYGVYAHGYTTIDGSTINAGTAVYDATSGLAGIVRLSNTMIDGSVSGSGITKCAGVYDENFTFYANNCP
jgi:hypothetical protein